MQNKLERLNWDSDFFGYAIGRIRADSLNTDQLNGLIYEAKAAGYRLVYLFVNPGDDVSNHAALECKASLADQKVTFRTDVLKQQDVFEDEHIIDYASETPTEKLVELSLQSGIYSRYKTDPNFIHNEFEKLYLAWIENSVIKKIASHTLVYMEAGNELGVVTAKVTPQLAQIGIIAVDEHTRGKSIGSKLMKHLMAMLKQKDIPLLEVATQLNNTNACNFYKKLGFHAHTTENIYHIWL